MSARERPLESTPGIRARRGRYHRAGRRNRAFSGPGRRAPIPRSPGSAHGTVPDLASDATLSDPPVRCADALDLHANPDAHGHGNGNEHSLLFGNPHRLGNTHGDCYSHELAYSRRDCVRQLRALREPGPRPHLATQRPPATATQIRSRCPTGDPHCFTRPGSNQGSRAAVTAPSATPNRESAPRLLVTDLGRMPYRRAWALQKELVAERKNGGGADRVLLMEHEAVLTLGHRGKKDNVLASPELLERRGIETIVVERAGDVTYHGPGQLVAYPILDLRRHRRDVRWYVELLLGAVVDSLAEFGIAASISLGRETGVWTAGGGGREKIAALGVRIERWVTYHGVAINVDPDLSAYDLIVPCGLSGMTVTSMARELGETVGIGEVKAPFVYALARRLEARVMSAELAAEPQGLVQEIA